MAFVVQPSLLFAGGTVTDFMLALIRILLAIALITAASVGHVRRPIALPMRILLGLLSVVMIIPFGAGIDALLLWLGFAVGIALFGWTLKSAPLQPAAVSHD
jgi:TRAP-type uncharacterized transport system fused permease subunit